MSTLTSERLILRKFKKSDAEAMFLNWTQDERVARYCRWHPHKSIVETKQYLNICMNAQYCWAITLKEKDMPIGCIDLVGINSSGIHEIGYVLAYEYWNQGIMTEALNLMIDYLFNSDFDVLCACHAKDNPASGRVMEKAGMSYVRDGFSLRKFGSDELIEVKYYEIRKNAVG